ncbi:hypothetical protein [Roseateles saccharophilus]|uniref:Ig-like domain-containing protein n=1 Tax=Roseateles saccharophilus TaxID=304 RepID=A0A4R3VF23_ROSSA|nr:hypothetical protein [Roseateles saccharophilus]MDG0835456.1 hypothetical protein [Roseateles saccharophilus]TCV04016.1 hypothetical protein EV671_1002286 [Roseateles saccharophilus]
MTQKVFRHGQKLTLLATCAVLAACGGGGGGSGTSGGLMQSINMSLPFGATLLTGPYTLKATATSGLPVTYKSNTPSTCTVSGDQLTLVAAGECSVMESQPGGTSADGKVWAAADSLSGVFVVLKHPQTVTFAPPDYVLSANASSVTLSASSDSGLPVTFTADTPANCSITGSTLQLLGKGTCAVTAMQAGNDNYAAKSVQRFIAVDPLLLADGFSGTNGTGAGSSNQLLTAQGGGVTVNPWDSTLGSGWEWCGNDRPDWCYHSVSTDGKTLKSALEVPKDKFPTGWHYGFNKIDIFVPGKTSFASSGDTTGGLRVTTEKALGFTMDIPQGLYSAGKPIVAYLDLGKNSGGCNVELATLVWPRAAGPVSYNVPLSNFAVTNNCGISGVTAASVDNDVRNLPNPWDAQGNPANLAAFNTALDGFKDARTSATTLMGSSDIIRMRLRLFSPNDTQLAGTSFYSSSISIIGAITIQ